MTKLSTTTEKPAPEVVNLHERDGDDDDSSDDDMKKNIYNEIPEYDDVDEVKLAVEALDVEAALRRQNAANENLYSEIQTSEERFENALYMAANAKDVEEKQKANASIAVFPSMSPKTRSFYPVGAALPSIPPEMIPEEKEPSWCCGTRRRRRRSLVIGLFIAVFFLLFLCIALMLRMYMPPSGDDDGFQGFADEISTAEFLQLETEAVDGSWETDNQIVPTTDEPRKKTFHTASICTSWQGRRRLNMVCPEDDDRIEIVRSFYGWSKSETVCNEVGRDTYCRIPERDTKRCNRRNDCEFWADPSGWLIGCSGLHDYLQVDYYCVPSS